MGEPVALVPDTAIPIERLGHIGELMGKADCGSWQERRQKALAMYRLMYDEARGLASSYKEREALSGILFMMEWLDLGEEQAQENAKVRLHRGYP